MKRGRIFSRKEKRIHRTDCIIQNLKDKPHNKERIRQVMVNNIVELDFQVKQDKTPCRAAPRRVAGSIAKVRPSVT